MINKILEYLNRTRHDCVTKSVKKKKINRNFSFILST